MSTPTRVRAGRAAALLMAIQASKGQPVWNFISGSAGRAWTDEYLSDVRAAKSDPSGWMTSPLMDQAARFTITTAREGGIRAKATPTSLEWFLRSNWGAFASGEFTLASQVNEWVTLAFLESVLPGEHYMHRIYDAWFHTLALDIKPFEEIKIEALYAAEQEQQIETPGAVAHPAYPMDPDDQNVFPGRTVTLYRDPDGENAEIPLHLARVVLDQGVLVEWDMMRGLDAVLKGGYPGPRVTLDIEAHVCAETWPIIEAARAGVLQAYRLVALAQDPATTFQIDFHAMDFEVEPIGHQGPRFTQFRARGTAVRNSDGDFVDITLS